MWIKKWPANKFSLAIFALEILNCVSTSGSFRQRAERKVSAAMHMDHKGHMLVLGSTLELVLGNRLS